MSSKSVSIRTKKSDSSTLNLQRNAIYSKTKVNGIRKLGKGISESSDESETESCESESESKYSNLDESETETSSHSCTNSDQEVNIVKKSPSRKLKSNTNSSKSQTLTQTQGKKVKSHEFQLFDLDFVKKQLYSAFKILLILYTLRLIMLYYMQKPNLQANEINSSNTNTNLNSVPEHSNVANSTEVLSSTSTIPVPNSLNLHNLNYPDTNSTSLGDVHTAVSNAIMAIAPMSFLDVHHTNKVSMNVNVVDTNKMTVTQNQRQSQTQTVDNKDKISETMSHSVKNKMSVNHNENINQKNHQVNKVTQTRGINPGKNFSDLWRQQTKKPWPVCLFYTFAIAFLCAFGCVFIASLVPGCNELSNPVAELQSGLGVILLIMACLWLLTKIFCPDIGNNSDSCFRCLKRPLGDLR